MDSAYFTVVSDDFGTITCFWVPTSAGKLGIARPWYQIHHSGWPQVSAGRFCEITYILCAQAHQKAPKTRHFGPTCRSDLLTVSAALSTLSPRVLALPAPSDGRARGAHHFFFGLGNSRVVTCEYIPLDHEFAQKALK